MIAILLVGVLGAATYVLPRVGFAPSAERDRFAMLMLAGFVIRLGSHFVIRNVALFSHGGASQGDAGVYETGAWIVARLWEYQGFQWFDADQIGIRETTNALLVVHLYAGIAFLNGGETTTVGCTAVNAFLAAMTCLHLVRLGTMIKGTERDARTVALAMYFSPAFVFHTADLFKDGLSAFLVVSAVLVAFRLSSRFTVADAAAGCVCLLLLWNVRYYLVFLVSAPLVLSLLGVRNATSVRFVVMTALVLLVGLILLSTQLAGDAYQLGAETFERATDENALTFNASGGSGVEFSGSSWASFPQRLAYTLFSPFPWDFRSTSVGFQIGKIDALIWVFFLFRAMRGLRRMWSDDRGTVLMFVVVLVPMIVAYATTMANIGLILRQRIPIVMLGAVLAVRGTPSARNEVVATEAAPAATG